MQMTTPTCPACHQQVAPERMFGRNFVCECGWTENTGTIERQIAQTRSTSRGLVWFSLLAVLGLVFFTQKDTATGKILMFRAKTFLVGASVEEAEAAAKSCRSVSNLTCESQALQELIRLKPQEFVLIGERGIVETELGNHRYAVELFKNYFNRGGRALKAARYYGRALAELNFNEKSKEYYWFVLNSKPTELQADVAREFAHGLLKKGDYMEAKRVINFARGQDKKATYFMAEELKSINRRTASLQ